MNQIEKHEDQRRKLWCDTWVSTANANDCKKQSVATSWADKALEEFDKRFPEPFVDKTIKK